MAGGRGLAAATGTAYRDTGAGAKLLLWAVAVASAKAKKQQIKDRKKDSKFYNENGI